jgi:hypothetical protein
VTKRRPLDGPGTATPSCEIRVVRPNFHLGSYRGSLLCIHLPLNVSGATSRYLCHSARSQAPAAGVAVISSRYVGVRNFAVRGPTPIVKVYLSFTNEFLGLSITSRMVSRRDFAMRTSLPDHGLPLVQLKERRRDLIVALKNCVGPLGGWELMQIAAVQQAISAFEDVVADLDAEAPERVLRLVG